MIAYTPEESRLARVLNAVALIAAGLSAIALVGTYMGPAAAPFFVPALSSSSAAGLGFLAMLAWLTAADVRRFRFPIVLLTALFVMGGAVFLALIFSVSGSGHNVELLAGAIVCAAAALVLIWMLRAAKMAAPPWSPWLPDKPLTTWERIGRGLLGLIGAALVIVAALHVVVAFTGPDGSSGSFSQTLMVGGILQANGNNSGQALQKIRGGAIYITRGFIAAQI